MKPPATMQQIADALGLNRVTVSLVLNGHAERRGVSQKTVDRVNTYLRETGYVPSREAVALRTGRRSGLGVLHCGHLDSHLTQAFDAMIDSQADQPLGAEVIVRPREGIIDGLKELVSRGVEQAVWILTGDMPLSGVDRDEILALGRRLKPVVYNYRFGIDEDEAELLANGFSLVGVSRSRGYRQLAKFLKREKHRQVLLPDAWGDPEVDVCSLIGAVRGEGLEPFTLEGRKQFTNPDLVCRGQAYGRSIAELLEQGAAFTSVCFRDDEVAAGAISELLDSGIQIPKDLSIVSMDGHPLGEVFRVPLTTYALPVAGMVAKTLELCARADADGDAAESCCFPYKLIRRRSFQPNTAV